MTHLLVTNDFPPKLGGIQSYLYELWRRLDPDRFVVLTTSHEGDVAFDRSVSFRVERVRSPMLFPTPSLARRIRGLADEIEANLVVLDPALPLGAVGQRVGRPYAVILHGAEVTVPARLPGARQLLSHVLSRAELVIAAGGYPAREARALVGLAMPQTVIVPPGVDVERFRPARECERRETRRELGVAEPATLVVSVSRLVPRKGMDVLVEAATRLSRSGQNVEVLIGGSGRDRARLARLIERLDAPVRLLGRVPNEDLPALNAAADVWAMLCRNRWGGLEQEGFGIVFLEAAAVGIAQVAGKSGGSDEAVLDEVTGLVVDRPADVVVVEKALTRLVENPELRARFGDASRRRVIEDFDYDVLAHRLSEALSGWGG